MSFSRAFEATLIYGICIAWRGLLLLFIWQGEYFFRLYIGDITAYYLPTRNFLPASRQVDYRFGG